MELPKNITQIGETDKSCKIYMEDYVVSYMKQMNRFAEDKEIAIALYGRRSTEQAVTYLFAYGACKLNYLQRMVKHLSQAQNQEIETLRRKYFSECEFIGYIVLNGEMIEGMYVSEPNGCRYIKGYACFYEKNDNMLAYMLDNRVEEPKPEEVELEKYELARKRQEERKLEHVQQEVNTGWARSERSSSERNNVEQNEERSSEVERSMRGMRFAAASMFVLLCLVSVVTLQTEGLSREVGSKLKNLFQGVSTAGNSEDTQQVMSGDIINTLVAEEQLAEAIRQENQQPVGMTAEVAAPTEMPTMIPVQEPTPAPTQEPTPVPTQEPTPIPTVVPTVAPTAVPVQTENVRNTYIIRSGDTLIGISTSLYGSESYVEAICQLNNISNPDNIQIGQKILLP
ncbi:MAG: LysM peptidoglycan-binding domain-containing protein [Lachnospiraceae bacterium]|nr:LysM peptidoglycan-binding domain-containing protein [Lachnospiraceae bacterium]